MQNQTTATLQVPVPAIIRRHVPRVILNVGNIDEAMAYPQFAYKERGMRPVGTVPRAEGNITAIQERVIDAFPEAEMFLITPHSRFEADQVVVYQSW